MTLAAARLLFLSLARYSFAGKLSLDKLVSRNDSTHYRSAKLRRTWSPTNLCSRRAPH